MQPLLRRAVAIVLAAGLTSALAACGGTVGPRAEGVEDAGCVPAWPHVSADVVRPGGLVTVTTAAVACRPAFERGTSVKIVWSDHAGRRTRLAAVDATEHGAIEHEVRIPKTSGTGFGELFVTGIEVPCDDTASCAAYAVGIDVVDSTPRFDSATRANHVASDLAQRMAEDIDHRPSYFEIAIVPDGLEVWLHTTAFDRETRAVQRAFTAAQAAAPAAERPIADQARLHTTFVRHSRASLQRISDRILADRDGLLDDGIEPLAWWADADTDSVRVELRTYTDEAALALLDRYGAAVSVSPKDHEPAIAA